jgi:class 3 adenylate cyclase/tetratricopeptide (TPR) repeat protein
VPVCAQCGTENPGAARFCMACGEPMAVHGPPDEVRKTVTVVFSDVVGSTPLGERLDPEALRRLMTRYFDRMKAVVERHGGVVEKFIGDAVMAVFGIPAVHEDDALRAVRAAAEMRSALADLNRELARDHGVTVEARTGVNTGKVVAGDPSRGQTLATGDAINTAARLQQAAGPGEILLGAPTFRLVRDGVKVDTMEPLELKGKEGAVEAFRLRDVLPEAEAISRRLDSPMVGREREGQVLRLAFDRAVEEKTCHLVTVLGSAGVGKSRLIEEFLGSLADEVAVLRGRCLPYGEGITFWPVAEVIRHAAGIGEEEPAEDARTRLRGLLEGEEGADIIFERVAQVLGLTADSAVPEETFWAIRKLLEALARRRPLAIVFDDIHWAEPTFLDLVEHVADFSRDAPLLLVCLSRQELLDRRPGWGGGKVNATAMLLEPLDETECDILIENLLGRARLSKEARDRIVEAAEGNPLFVEEMLSMLIDEGLLVRQNGDWVPTSDLSKVAVPPTIQALLAARLEHLDREERAVMQRASVMGRVFYRGAVADMSPEPARQAVGTHLATLVRRELIRPHATEFSDETYRFRHILIRDAAYEAMPKETRAELHEQFAGWLEVRAGERLREYEEFLGYHLERAHRYRAELGPLDEHGRGLGERAGELLGRAGLRAETRGDVAGAINLLERATALLPEADPARIRLLPVLGSALQDAAQFDRAGQLLNDGLELAARAGERAAELALHLKLVLQRVSTDPSVSFEEGLREAEGILLQAEELDDPRILVEAHHAVAILEFWSGRSAKAEEIAEKAIARAEEAGLSVGQTFELYRALFSATVWGHTPVDRGMERWQGILKKASGALEGWAFSALATLHAMRGEFDEARAYNERSDRRLLELGLLLPYSAGHIWAAVEELAGNPEGVEWRMREGIEELRTAGETGYLSTSAVWLAEALYEQGRYDEALDATRLSQETTAPGDVASQAGWRSIRAKIYAVTGRLEEAETLAREAVTVSDTTDHLKQIGDVRMALATVLRAGGRPEEAVEVARRALDAYEQKGNVVSAGRTRQFMEELASEA